MKKFEPEYRDVLRIAAPISFSLLIPQVSFVANTLFIAPLGAEGLSVIGMVGVYYLLLTWMCYGLSNGMLVMLSRRAGAEDIPGYGAVFRHGLLCGGIFVALLLSISYLLGGWFYSTTLHDAALAVDAAEYLYHRLPGLPFLMLNQLLNVFLISSGRTMWLLIGSIAGNAVNILFDWILIYGHWGFEPMGVPGAAVASVLGELVYSLVMVSLVLVKGWHRSYQLMSAGAWRSKLFRDVLIISSPLIFQYIFSIGGWQIYFIYMEHLGRDEVAATHILRNALGVIGIGAWALASTSNTLAGNLLGQQRTKDVFPGIKKVMTVAALYGISASLFLYFAKDSLLPYFTTDAQVSYLVHQGLEIIYGSSIVLCIATVLFNAMIGIGATRMSMYFEISSVLLYVLYLTVAVPILGLDFWWAWTSEYAYWGLLLVLSGGFLLRKNTIRKYALRALRTR